LEREVPETLSDQRPVIGRRVGLHGLFAQKHAAICVCRVAKK